MKKRWVKKKRDKISMCHSPKRQRINKNACVTYIDLFTNMVFWRKSDTTFTIKIQVKYCQNLS